jgi:hypothetical protein
MTFPVSRARSADLGPANGRWAWQDAPALRLDEALLDEACALLDELDAAISTGDANRVWALSEPLVRDTLRAYPTISQEMLRADLAGLLDRCSKVSTPVVVRERARHDFRLVGRDKLLQLVDDDWSPSFKLVDVPGAEPMGYPMMLGRVGAELRIVR